MFCRTSAFNIEAQRYGTVSSMSSENLDRFERRMYPDILRNFARVEHEHIPKNMAKPRFVELFDEHGNRMSPQLADETKNFLIDIDGTICDDIPNEEPERMATCEPYDDALEICNKWYEEGHIITFFTSRTEAHREVTETWLNKHGFKYHALLVGKPRGGNYHWIDNHIVKATRFKGKFTDLILKEHVIEVFDH